jgi:predicted DNA-binding protein (MmcQ/YjbR family)
MPAKAKKDDSPLQRRLAALRDFALTYPETTEDFPWGHRTIKVRGKIFLFVDERDGALAVAVKLPFSGEEALRMPFARPTPYGMGKHGWVSATLKIRDLPLSTLQNWIDESYRAVAPKALAKKAVAPA